MSTQHWSCPEPPPLWLRGLFDAAVQQAQPARVLPAWLPEPPPLLGRTWVLGAGKAAAAMAAAVEAHWPADAPLGGVVVCPYGHIPPGVELSRIELLQAAHPVPDAASEVAARRMLAVAAGLDEHALVIALLSGGGSALLCAPALGLSAAHKKDIHRALLRSGATIAEINTVRKHLSAIKGGQLAVACGRARVVTLMISDVPGDDASLIASGPTVPDASTCADALAVLAKYGIDAAPQVQTALRAGLWETPKPGDSLFARHSQHLVATPRQSLEAAAASARASGVAAHVLSDAIEGEAAEVGALHAAIARSVADHGTPFAPPCVLLSGGETTVSMNLTGARHTSGRGGRAGEFLLGAALALNGHPRIWALAADTDGIDGSGSSAGAVIGPSTLERARARGMSLAQARERHDAHGAFSALGDAVVTGPTYTNVNDFRALLIV